MIRRNFIRSITAIGAGYLVQQKPEEAKEEIEDNVAILTIKKNGKTYKLGFRLTKDKEKNERGLGFLAKAGHFTIHPPVIRKFE